MPIVTTAADLQRLARDASYLGAEVIVARQTRHYTVTVDGTGISGCSGYTMTAREAYTLLRGILSGLAAAHDRASRQLLAECRELIEEEVA